MFALPRLFAVCCLAIPAIPYPSIDVQAPSSQQDDGGPVKGWLILEGGGPLSGTTTASRFTALAGGADANVVVISTAIADSQFVPDKIARCQSRTAEILGVTHLTCVDARSRDEANSARFLEKLEHASGVWIYGGDEERLVDRYVGTKVVDALQSVLDRGGVIGGTSAGAMILGSYIPLRARQSVSAFGFLAHTAIAPHYTQRNYEPVLRKLLESLPSFRGIGIDESASIVVHSGAFEVIGSGTVTVFKSQKVVLKPGDGYDLKSDTAKKEG